MNEQQHFFQQLWESVLRDKVLDVDKAHELLEKLIRDLSQEIFLWSMQQKNPLSNQPEMLSMREGENGKIVVEAIFPDQDKAFAFCNEVRGKAVS